MNFDMIKQARELKSQLDKAQKELDKMVVESDTNRGAVKIKITGKQKVMEVIIDPKFINPDNPKQIQDLMKKAFNEAVDKSQKEAAKQLKGLTGGLKIPGLT